MIKTCETCGKEYEAKNQQQKYCNTFTCGPAARKRHHRWRILERDGFRCIYCGSTPWDDGIKLHLDHVIALASGGDSVAGNIVASCKSCNLSKNIRPLREVAADLILKEVRRRNEVCNIPDQMPAGEGQYLKH